MTATWQTVRAFILSTFRDMPAERDWLVKRVPALRAGLESYRMHLVDIDLRWSVTEEQSNNDEALDESYGWIRHHTGKSITELEILPGVLNNPEMHTTRFSSSAISVYRRFSQ